MATEKYGKYIKEGVGSEIIFLDHQTQGPIRFMSSELFQGGNFMFGCEYISHPWLMDPFPLKHLEADQILGFLGTNHADWQDFDAEIEFHLGEEQEKHIITKPTMIFIPRGLVHCPLDFKRIGKTVQFINIILGKYTRLLFRDNAWKIYKDIAAERAGTPFELPKASK